MEKKGKGQSKESYSLSIHSEALSQSHKETKRGKNSLQFLPLAPIIVLIMQSFPLISSNLDLSSIFGLSSC